MGRIAAPSARRWSQRPCSEAAAARSPSRLPRRPRRGRPRALKAPPPDAPALAVGITEPNPNFFAVGDVPAEFAHWRDELVKIHPAYYRVIVDWSALQPQAGKPPIFDSPNQGCLRDKPPCGAFGGIRSVFKALGERQKADGGWEALVVLVGTPEWAASPPSGCERKGTLPRSRPPGPATG